MTFFINIFIADRRDERTAQTEIAGLIDNENLQMIAKKWNILNFFSVNQLSAKFQKTKSTKECRHKILYYVFFLN